MLRFAEIGRFRAENRPKSSGKIWNRTKNVVPLHCQSEDRRALKMRDTKRDSATRCSWPKLSLIPCKNTFKHYGKDFV